MTQDLNYYESGYIETGYYTYTADAESQVQTTATLTVSVGRIQSTTVSINSSFSQSCIISHIEGADLFAFAEASLAAQIDRIRDNNILVSAVFSAAIDGTRGIYVSAQADSIFSIDIYNTRIRNEEVATNAAFSISATGELIAAPKELAADLTATFTQTVSGNRFVSIDINLSSSFTQNTINERVRDSSASLESSFEQTAKLTMFSGVVISLESNFEQTTTAYRIIEVSCNIESLFTPSIVCNPIRNTFAVLDSVATLTIDAVKISNISASILSEFTETVNFNRIRKFDSIQSCEFSQTLTAVILINESVVLLTESLLTANEIRIRTFVCHDNALFTPSIICNPIRNSFAVLDSVATLSVTSNVNKSIIANLSSNFIQSVTVKAYNEYWLNFAQQTLYFNSCTAITSNESYVTFSTDKGTYGGNLVLIKFDHYGSIIFQKKLTISNYYLEPTVIKVASSGNVYISASVSIGTGFTNYHSLIKFDSNGNLQWIKTLNVGTTGEGIYPKLVLDSSENSYITGYGRNSKFNSSGTILYQKSRTMFDTILLKDSTNNLYMAGGVSGAGNNVFEIYKTNSTFTTVSWSKRFSIGTSSTLVDIRGSAIDSNNNLYYLIRMLGNASLKFDLLIKLDSSGNLIWSKNIDDTQRTNEIGVDNFNNIILTKTDVSSSNLIITKLDSNGLVINEKTIIGTTLGVSTIAFDSSNNMYLIDGQTGYFKLPYSLSGNIDSPYSFVNSNTTSISNYNITLLTTSSSIATTSYTVGTPTGTLSTTNYTFDYYGITNVGSIKTASIDLLSNFNIIVNGNKFSNLSSSLQSNASLSATLIRAVSSSAALTSAFTETVTANRIKQFSAAFTAFYSEITVNGRIRAEVANLDAAFTQTTNISRTRNASISLTAFASELTINGRIRTDKIDLNSQFSLTSNITVIGDEVINCTSNFSATIIARKLKALEANVISTATLTTSIHKITGFIDTPNSIFTLTANGTKIITAKANLPVIASEITVNGRLRAEVADFDVTTTLTTTANRLRTVRSNQNANCSLSCNVQIDKTTVAHLLTDTSLFAFAGISITDIVNLHSIFTQQVTGRIIDIVPALTWTIEPELAITYVNYERFIYTIPEEYRTIVVEQENRDYLIQEDNRTYII